MDEDLPLKNTNGFILPNLRSQLKNYLTTYELKVQFLEHVFPWDPVTLDTYLESQEQEEPGCFKAFHFQIYDFLRLNDDDKEKVLSGNQPDGYFEMPNKLTKAEIDAKFLRELKRIIFAAPGDVDGVILRKRLGYFLLSNHWTRSQFAYHVLGRDNGEPVAQFIEKLSNLSRHPFYRPILAWLEKSDNDRKIQINGSLDATGKLEIVDYPYLIKYLANPVEIDTNGQEFRSYMIVIARRQLEQLEKDWNSLDKQPVKKDEAVKKEELKNAEEILERLSISREKVSVINYDQPTEEKAKKDEKLKNPKLKHDYCKRAIAETKALVDFLSNPNIKEELNEDHRISIIKSALMTGTKLDHNKVAYCIRKVLRIRNHTEELFAKRMVKCSKEELQAFFANSTKDVEVSKKNLPIYWGVYRYLIRLDPTYVWTPVLSESTFHENRMRFLANPRKFDMEQPDFKERLRPLVEKQLRVITQELVVENAQDHMGLREATVNLLEYMIGSVEDPMYDRDLCTWQHRQRVMSLLFTNGTKHDVGKMASCLKHLLRDQSQRQVFAEKVVQCTLEEFESFLNTPFDYLPKLEEVQIARMCEYLMRDCADREKAMSGELDL